MVLSVLWYREKNYPQLQSSLNVCAQLVIYKHCIMIAFGYKTTEKSLKTTHIFHRHSHSRTKLIFYTPNWHLKLTWENAGFHAKATVIQSNNSQQNWLHHDNFILNQKSGNLSISNSFILTISQVIMPPGCQWQLWVFWFHYIYVAIGSMTQFINYILYSCLQYYNFIIITKHFLQHHGEFSTKSQLKYRFVLFLTVQLMNPYFHQLNVIISLNPLL